MSKEEDIDNDDWDDNWDDDLNFDDSFGGTPGASESDRTPVAAITGNALEGFADSATDADALRDVFERALPDNYRYAYNDASRLHDNVSRNTSKLIRTAREEGRNLQRATKNLAPFVEQYLGKSAGDKVRKFAGEDKAGYESNMPNPDDSFVSAALSEAMSGFAQTTGQQAAAAQAQTQTENLIRDTKAEQRSQSQATILTSIDNNTSIIQSYLNKVDLGFKRKGLEFQARAYLLQQKQFELQRTYSEASIRELQGITKNTALPDALKLRITENAAQLAQTSLIGKAQDKASSFASGYLGKITENITKWTDQKITDAKETVTAITDILGQLGEVAQMQADMDSMGGGGEGEATTKDGVNKGELLRALSSQVGRLGVTIPAEELGKKLNTFLSNNPEAIQKGMDVEYFRKNLFTMIPQLAEKASQDESDTAMGWIKRNTAKAWQVIAPQLASEREATFDRDMIRQGAISSASGTIGGDIVQDTVIPGWLQRIEYNTRVSAFGDGQEMSSFDPTTQSFTSKSKAADAISKHILPNGERENAIGQTDEIMQSLGIDTLLTDKDKQILRERLMKNAYRAGDSDSDIVSQLVKGKAYTGLSNEQALRAQARDKWAVGENVADEDISTFSTGDIETANLRKKLDANFTNLRNRASSFSERYNEILKLGIGQDLLSTAGFLKNNEHGKREFNYNKLFSDLVSDDKQLETAPEFSNGSQSLSNKARKQLSRMPPLSLAVDPKKPLSVNFADKTERFLKEQVTAIAEQVAAARVQNPNANPQQVNAMDGVESRLDQIINMMEVGQDSQRILEELIDESLDISSENGEVLGGILDSIDNLAVNYYNINSEGIVSKAKNFAGRQWRKAKGLPGKLFGAIKKLPGRALNLLRKPLRTAKYGYLMGKRKLRGLGGNLINMFNRIPLISKLPEWLGKGKDFLKEKGTAAFNFIRQEGKHAKDLFLDIYVKGEDKPRITGVGMARYAYIDVDTEKRIRSINDITGPVLSPDGQYAITEDDMHIGLETRVLGKARGIALGGANWLRKKVTNTLIGAKNLAMIPLRFIKNQAIKGAKFISNKLTAGKELANIAVDVYVPGEHIPRLYKVKMQQGRYFNRETGKPITGILDLTADIEDEDEQIVLSKEEIARGLVNSVGKKLALAKVKGLIGKAGEFLKGVAKAPFKILGNTLQGLKSLFTGGMLKALFLKLPDNVALRANVVNILTDGVANGESKKKTAGDVDGDGVRDGSYKDMMMDKATAAKAKLEAWWNKRKEKRAESQHEESLGMMATIAKLLKRQNKLTEDAGDGDSWVDDASDVADMFDGDGKKKKGRKGKGRLKNGLKKSKGFFSKWGGKALRGAKAVGSAAWTVAKWGGKAALTVGAVSLEGAAAVGSAVLGALSAPVVLGALAVVAISYAGYKTYQYMQTNRAPTDLEKLRHMQYGSDGTNQNFTNILREFESNVGKHVFNVNGGIDIGNPYRIFQENAALLGWDADDEEQLHTAFDTQFKDWFTYRFKPVYLRWLGAAAKYKTPLAQINDLLTTDKLVGLIAFTDVKPAGTLDPFNINVAPTQLEFTFSPNRADIKKYTDTLLLNNGKLESSKTAKDAPPPVKRAMAKIPTGHSYTDNVNVSRAIVAQAAKDASNKAGSVTSGNESAFTKMAKLSVGISGQAHAEQMSKVVISIRPDKKKEAVILSDMDEVRYYQYGVLKADTLKVGLIQSLEIWVNSNTTITATGVITDMPTVEVVTAEFADKFGAIDDAAKESFKQWYSLRFSPVFMKLLRQLATSAASISYLDFNNKIKDGEEIIRFMYSSICNRQDTIDGHVPFTIPANPFGKPYPLETDVAKLQAFVSVTVDEVQKKYNIKDVVEDKVKLSLMKAFIAKARKDGEAFVGNLPALTQFGDASKSLMSAMTDTAGGDAKSNTYNIPSSAPTAPVVNQYKSMGGKIAPHKITDDTEKRIAQYDQIIADASEKYKVDQNLIRSVIRQESHGRSDARSKYAAGLMQFTPGTAKDWGVNDVFNPVDNIMGGARYLAHLLKKTDGDVRLALAGYNAGPGWAYGAMRQSKETGVDPVALLRSPSLKIKSRGKMISRSAASRTETDNYITKITKDYASRTGTPVNPAQPYKAASIGENGAMVKDDKPNAAAPITRAPATGDGATPILPAPPVTPPAPAPIEDSTTAALSKPAPSAKPEPVIANNAPTINNPTSDWQAATAAFQTQSLEKFDSMISLLTTLANKETTKKTGAVSKPSQLDHPPILDNKRKVF